MHKLREALKIYQLGLARYIRRAEDKYLTNRQCGDDLRGKHGSDEDKGMDGWLPGKIRTVIFETG
jgi:hypothetical protein